MIKKYKKEDILEAKKLQRNLLKIKLHGKAPINLTQYKKHDLIYSKTIKKDRYGNPVSTKLFLTPKGKRMLNVMLQ